MLNFLINFFRYKRQTMLAGGRTDQGLLRKQNEDAFHIMNNRRIFLVADGMGGHNAGEVASKAAIEALVDYFTKIPGRRLKNSAESIQHALITGFRQANAVVINKALADQNLQGMGCTLVACLIDDDVLHCCHVGDARCYLAQPDTMIQITHDHTILAAIKQDHSIDQTNEIVLPKRHVVTRAIGYIFKEDPEYNRYPIKKGDRILLCSDGLWSMLTDTEIHQILMSTLSPQAMAEQLINRANEEGGKDNITAVVIHY